MDLAIDTHGLTRHFGDVRAVDGLDLAVPAGSFYGYLGPNGAGKSTTLKCLTGLLRPTAGTQRVLGLDPFADGVAMKRRIGVVPEEIALFERLSARETLTFVGRVHGLDAVTIAHRADELLELLELHGAGDRLVADYSHGMKKKLALAVALLPGPELLFLDEPFEGIDAIASRQIKEVLQTVVHHGGTVFLTSHILEVVERLADHIGVINHGRIVAQGSLADLRAGSGATLEEIFMKVVGVEERERPALEWLG